MALLQIQKMKSVEVFECKVIPQQIAVQELVKDNVAGSENLSVRKRDWVERRGWSGEHLRPGIQLR